MSDKKYYTVEVNGIVKLTSQDFKSAYDATVFQKILGNDPILKQGNKILINKEK